MFDPHGFWWKGRYYPPIAGGDGTDDDAGGDKGDKGDSKPNGATKGKQTGSDSGGDDEEDDDDDDDDTPSKGASITLSSRAFKGRLNREQRRTRNAVAKEAGFKSYEDMQRHLETKPKGKDEDDDDDTDDKAATKSKSTSSDNAAITKLQKRLDALEAENTNLKRGNKAGDLQRVVERLAKKLNFIDADDAFAIGRFDNIVDELLDDKGNVDEDAIVDALDVLAEAKPHLIKSSRKKSDDDDDDDEDDEEEEEKPARRSSNRSSNSGPNPPRGGRNGTVSGTVSKKKQEEFNKRFPQLAKLRQRKSL